MRKHEWANIGDALGTCEGVPFKLTVFVNGFSTLREAEYITCFFVFFFGAIFNKIVYYQKIVLYSLC